MVILFTLMLTQTIYAQSFKGLNLQNFNLNYTNEEGRLLFDLLSLSFGSVETQLQQYDFDIRQVEGSLLLEKNDTLIKVSDIQNSFIKDIAALRIESGALTYEAGSLLLADFFKASFALGDGSPLIEKVKLSCRSSSKSSDQIDDIILPCFERGLLSSNKIIIDQNSRKTVASALALFNRGLEIKELNNVMLTINNNSLSLTFKAKIGINVNVKIKGDALYNAESNLITLVVESAKAGILDIKSRLLDEVKKANIQNLRVEGERIFIQL